MIPVLVVLLTVGIPVAIVVVQVRLPPAGRVNPIIFAYAAGLILSAALPHSDAIASVQDALSSATVALSIPLMLFAVDIRRWAHAGREALVSLLLAVVAVVVATTAAHLFFRTRIAESSAVGALLVGVYTGGTPNLAALRMALSVDTSLYLTIHTVDLFVSALYILVILAVGRRLVGAGVARGIGSGNAFRSGSQPASIVGDALQSPTPATPPTSDGARFSAIIAPSRRRESLSALGAAIAVVLLSVGASFLVPPAHRTVVTILSLSTLAIAATLIPGMRRLRTSFTLGEFFILIFSVTVGSMADVSRMVTASPMIIGYLVVVVFGSLVLHWALTRLFRVSGSTFLVTSISAVCSPPFVGMLAPIVRDPQIIAAGITTGIIGYAIGNYLGVFTAWLLALI